MKVLIYRHANHDAIKGGAEVQLTSTADALKRKKVKVEYSSNPHEDLSGYDLVHIFNSPRFDETRSYFDNAIRQKKPIAFSTIFWSKEDLAIGVARTAKVRIAKKILGENLSKAMWRIVKGQTKEQKVEKWLFENADVLLPNSEGEQREIERTYGIRAKKYHVVRNAIDTSLFAKEPEGKRENYVLSVGRIENRKNTIKLIEACHKLGLHLKLIGALDEHDDYARSCLELIKKYDVEHLDPKPQKELLDYYYSAKAHAMVSWYETPGLSSMEAACGGCNIVSTDLGSTKEYFGKNANYCSPFSQSSIEEALSEAIGGQSDMTLRETIMSEFTWDGAADDTLAGYGVII